MARHPDSPFKRQMDLGKAGTRERPVDSAGHCRSFAPVEQRAIKRAADGSIGFKGHAALFNSRTLIGGKRWGFYEEFAPGAFKKTIGEADVRMLFNHDPSYVLARNKAGTLRLAEDDLGLAVDADMGAYSYTDNLALALERGDITQMSFAFDPITYETLENASDGLLIIRHTESRLWDVSPVTYPQYTDTDASLRAQINQLPPQKRNLILVTLGDIDDEKRSDPGPSGPVATDAETPTCPSCTTAVGEDDLFCRVCGISLDDTIQNSDRGPAKTTRDQETPPAETTGHAPPTPFLRLAQLRAAELETLFRQENSA